MSASELNDLVVAALKRAMRAQGIEGNVAAFTRLLRGEVGDAPDPTTMGRWLRGEQTVPAWALVAASRASGISPSDLLLPEADAAELKRLVESLEAQMAELRSSLATAERGGADQPADAYDARLAQLAGVITRIQDSVETQGELLDRVAKQVLPRRSGHAKEGARGAEPSNRGEPASGPG